ncbi:MAG: TIR domain-containing protein [Bacteroidetes bacterium]|nr:TIR domain-containing protein [Bacteroidota bacterium]
MAVSQEPSHQPPARHPAEPRLHERISNRLLLLWDWPFRYLFGRDVFISYRRDDAQEYARNLADELLKQAPPKTSCYLDQWLASPTRKPPGALLRLARRSGVFVLVGTQGATTSESVEKEIREFSRSRRHAVLINVAGSLDRVDWDKRPWYDISGANRELREPAEAVAAASPSPIVMDQILKSLTFTRQDERLKRSVRRTAGAVLLLIAAAVGITSVVVANAQKEVAEAASRLADATRKTNQAEARTQDAEKQLRWAERRSRDADSIAKRSDAVARRNELTAKAAKQREKEANVEAQGASDRELLAITRADSASEQQRIAAAAMDRQEQITAAAMLANEAISIFNESPNNVERSVFFGIQSMARYDSLGVSNVTAYTALRNSLATMPLRYDSLARPRAWLASSHDIADHGNVIALSGDDTVLIINRQKKITTKITVRTRIKGIRLSSDGGRILVTHSSGFSVFDSRNGTLLDSVNRSSSFGTADISTTGDTVAYSFGTYPKYFLHARNIRQHMDIDSLPAPVGCIQFPPSPSRRGVAISLLNGYVILWHPGETQAYEILLKSPDETFHSLQFDTSGRHLAARTDTRVYVWDLDSVENQSTPAIFQQGDQIRSMAFKNTSRFINGFELATSGDDRIVRIWRNGRSQPVKEIRTEEAITSMAFSDNNNLLAMASNSSHVAWMLDLTTETISTVFERLSSPETIQFADNGNTVVIADYYGATSWSAQGALPITRLFCPGFQSLAYSQNGSHVALLTNSILGTALIIVDTAGTRSQQLMLPELGRALSISANRRTGALVVTGVNGVAAISGLYNYPLTVQRLISDSNITTADLDLHGHFLATGYVGSVKLWSESQSGGMELQETICLDPGERVTALAFSKQGGMLAIGSSANRILVYRIIDNMPVHCCSIPHSAAPTSMLFSNDGHHLVIGGRGDGIRVWHIGAESADSVVTIPIACSDGDLKLDPDGIYLATTSGYGDHIVRIWDKWRTAKPVEIARINDGEFGSLTAIAFSPDGRYIAAGGMESAFLAQWPWRPNDLMLTACQRLRYGISIAEWALSGVGNIRPMNVCH